MYVHSGERERFRVDNSLWWKKENNIPEWAQESLKCDFSIFYDFLLDHEYTAMIKYVIRY